MALLGDVHGNSAALNAVLDAVAAAGIVRGALTGDLVMRGLHPEAVVARVRSLGWPCVAGNTDRKVARRPPKPGWDARGMRPGSRSWSRAHLSDASVAFLAALPPLVRLQLGPASVVVIHGDQTVPPGAIDTRATDHDLARLADALRADCVVSGHTHHPLVRRVHGCVFVNPGSVGEGTHDDRRPSWAWITATADGVEATLQRVDAHLALPRDHPATA
ncbi:MAG: metallophosphatase family protein [Thermoleophilia bacterium]|nr:metallophosphatase family protein [Thermoleophilia bacterium]